MKSIQLHWLLMTVNNETNRTNNYKWNFSWT